MIKNKWINPMIIWDWADFGICLTINKLTKSSDYKFAIDFQIGWFNLWTQFWKKPLTSKEQLEKEMSSKYGDDSLMQSLTALENSEVRKEIRELLNKNNGEN
jgi:hypothetical protein